MSVAIDETRQATDDRPPLENRINPDAFAKKHKIAICRTLFKIEPSDWDQVKGGIDENAIRSWPNEYGVNYLKLPRDLLMLFADKCGNPLPQAQAGGAFAERKDIDLALKYQFSVNPTHESFTTSRAWLAASETDAQQYQAMLDNKVSRGVSLDKIMRRLRIYPATFHPSIVKMILECLDDNEKKAMDKWKNLVQNKEKMQRINDALPVVASKLGRTMSELDPNLKKKGRKKKGAKRSDVCNRRWADFNEWLDKFQICQVCEIPDTTDGADDEKTRSIPVRGEDTSKGQTKFEGGEKTQNDKPDLGFWWTRDGLGICVQCEWKPERVSKGIPQSIRNCVHQAAAGDDAQGIRVRGLSLLVRGTSSFRVVAVSFVREKLHIEMTREIYCVSVNARRSVADLLLSLLKASPRSMGWYQHPEGYTLKGCVGQGAECVVIQAQDTAGEVVAIKFYRDREAFEKARTANDKLGVMGIAYENRETHCFDCAKPNSWNGDELFAVFEYHLSRIEYAASFRWNRLARDLNKFHNLSAQPIHCDVSPNNVVLDSALEVLRITDVGSLKLENDPPGKTYYTTPLFAPDGEPTSRKWDQTMLLRTVQFWLWAAREKTIDKREQWLTTTLVEEDLSGEELDERVNRVVEACEKIQTPAPPMSSSMARLMVPAEPMDMDMDDDEDEDDEDEDDGAVEGNPKKRSRNKMEAGDEDAPSAKRVRFK